MASEDHETFFHIDDRPIALLTTTSRSALPARRALPRGASPAHGMESPRRRCGGTRRRCAARLGGGFTKCAKLRTAHAAWRDEGRGARTRIPPARRGFPHRRRTLRGAPRPSAHLDRPPTSRAPPDALTDLANAALLSDRGPTHPLPERVAALPRTCVSGDARAPRCSSFPSPRRLTPFPPAPSNRSQLEARVLAKRRATLAAALRRVGAVLLEAEDDDPGSHSSESKSLPEEKKNPAPASAPGPPPPRRHPSCHPRHPSPPLSFAPAPSPPPAPPRSRTRAGPCAS